MPRYSYGGQALIEGVLMRGRNAIAVAFRHPDGRIVWATEQLDSGIHRTGLAKLPLLRGLVVLYEPPVVGTRWLLRSRSRPTAHPLCGTEFLVVVIALSIIAFTFVGRQEPVVMISSRVLLIPVIAAVGYELLRWGARHRANPIVRSIMWPGILVQMITT